MHMNFTPKEIAYIHDRNENFHGTDMNLKNVRHYYELKEERDEFCKHCEHVYGTGEYDPNPHEKHALMWLDCSSTLSIADADLETFAHMIKQADRVIIVNTERGIRVSMVIESIWER